MERNSIEENHTETVTDSEKENQAEKYLLIKKTHGF
jgi:hypothetical protein